MSEWIKCSERMPDKDSKVIAYTSFGQIIFGMHYRWKKYELQALDPLVSECTSWQGSVTHWMPLPEPPTD